jgi:hypothetical protein
MRVHLEQMVSKLSQPNSAWDGGLLFKFPKRTQTPAVYKRKRRGFSRVDLNKKARAIGASGVGGSLLRYYAAFI